MERHFSLVVVGFGQVGRMVCRQALNVGIPVCGVVDSSGGLLFDRESLVPSGRDGETFQALTHADLDALDALKAQGSSLASSAASASLGDLSSRTSFMANVADIRASVSGYPVPCVADCSGSGSAYSDYLEYFFDNKVPTALANKKPLSESMAAFTKLTSTDPYSLVGYEATVGAGLPVINTAQRMVASGDTMTKVEGQLSGTLGYILSALQGGGKFSDIVLDAKAQGFTEPDPRDDLSGTDVARKALILARIFGEQVELADLEVEALYPAEFADLPLDEFMARLPELDAGMEARMASARSADKLLRYAAVVEPGKTIRVGPVEVEASSPLASLQGTDNLVSFSSKWYNTSPVVVRGPGAGIEVTAAGVLADCIKLRK